jgi:hypothetical protein
MNAFVALFPSEWVDFQSFSGEDPRQFIVELALIPMEEVGIDDGHSCW